LGDKSVVVGGNMDKTSASVLASMPVFIFGGRVSSEIVKRFSPKSDIEQIRSNIQQIQQLQQDLQNASSESVRNQIQQKIFEIEEANDNVFQKASETISNMDDARYNRVNEITKQQANLQVQAESILNDTGLSNDRKKSLINELNNQFTELESTRNAIIEGTAELADLVSPQELIRLKDQASRELVQEAGEQDIQLNDAQITERAIQIFNRQDVQTKEAQPETQIKQDDTRVVEGVTINENEK